MTITIKKKVQVTETFEVNLPVWYGKIENHLPYDEYLKVVSENEYIMMVLYKDGDFHCTRRINDIDEAHKFISESIEISEEQFLKAVQECYTRFFLAAETSKDETEEVTAFEDILT